MGKTRLMTLAFKPPKIKLYTTLSISKKAIQSRGKIELITKNWTGESRPKNSDKTNKY